MLRVIENCCDLQYLEMMKGVAETSETWNLKHPLGFPFKDKQIKKSSSWFNRFGKWSLLFAWVPIIGDPLTLVAGLLRVRFLDFIILVAIGKVSRYLVVFYLIG